ncbi:uncharacterized protein [Macrobrachium rosenbergii]|uniref:uncharacterized protein n=1 Tax=Macrobrachium rosenbergii TaxID=79674 RepID=UPI0034D70AC7
MKTAVKMDEKYGVHLIVFLLLNITNVIQGLRITKVGVPGPLVTGEGGWLECEWDLEDDGLYAVKWYLGLSEFYRWTPAEHPAVKTFPIEGNPIRVDLTASHQGRVRIQQVTLDAGGVYRCEVSAEAPSFHTESAVALMRVVDLPDRKPLITGAQISYQMHEDVMLNCSSPNSQPPATLKFYVNDEQADPTWLIRYDTLKIPGSNYNPATFLETAVLGLQFPLWPRLLRQGNVNVKCTAEIPDLYWDSSEVFIAGDIPYHASIMEDRASATLSSASTQGRMRAHQLIPLASVFVFMMMM